ncbi:hypothetical protein CcNV_017 [Crangon crangon nudivirus]|uniref:Uncharacterized protein n=1 Tax=Crangon crangon nudivirus TaxID=2880838 RepID=A0AAE8Y0J4_9VIRU|nr:hypothetical protein QKT25_gp017 [Crangon crangon nudivirus]UBZ25501.1 hypothetical protein CcNV_017 [Crangon crangon nudivirus]
MSVEQFQKGINLAISPAMMSRYKSLQKLKELVEKFNLFHPNHYYTCNETIRSYIDVNFTEADLNRAIYKNALKVNDAAWKYTYSGVSTYNKASAGDGDPFRYTMIKNYLMNDKHEGLIHADFKARPLEHLKYGVITLMGMQNRNTKEPAKWFSMIEATFNGTQPMEDDKGTKQCIVLQGRATAGCTLLAEMLTAYVPTTHISKINPPTSLTKNRICFINGPLPEMFEDDYIKLFKAESIRKPTIIHNGVDDPFHCLSPRLQDMASYLRLRSTVIKMPNIIPLYESEYLPPHFITPLHYLIMLCIEKERQHIRNRLYDSESDLDEYLNKFIVRFKKYHADWTIDPEVEDRHFNLVISKPGVYWDIVPPIYAKMIEKLGRKRYHELHEQSMKYKAAYQYTHKLAPLHNFLPSQMSQLASYDNVAQTKLDTCRQEII